MATAERDTEQKQSSGNMLDDLLSKPAMSRELAMVRMENESMMAECRVRPRDFDDIKAELLQQLKAFPEMAAEAVYEKPVGKDESGRQKYVRGLSIRAAESLAEAYRYNRIRSDVVEVDGDKVKIEATFTDFQGGRIWQDSGLLSKTYKDRNGRLAKFNDDRFYNVIVKAEVSKRVREVILRSVNAGLKAWFESECEKIADGLLDDATINKIVKQFETMAVTLEMLEALIGRQKAMGWVQADRTRLLGVWNAIRDGETTVNEVFSDRPPMELPTPTKQPPASPRKADDVDADLVERFRATLAACKDADAIEAAIQATQALGDVNEATWKAIDGEVAARRTELSPAPKVKKQGSLVQ
jgi:hypothetical protein